MEQYSLWLSKKPEKLVGIFFSYFVITMTEHWALCLWSYDLQTGEIEMCIL